MDIIKEAAYHHGRAPGTLIPPIAYTGGARAQKHPTTPSAIASILYAWMHVCIYVYMYSVCVCICVYSVYNHAYFCILLISSGAALVAAVADEHPGISYACVYVYSNMHTVICI